MAAFSSILGIASIGASVFGARQKAKAQEKALKAQERAQAQALKAQKDAAEQARQDREAQLKAARAANERGREGATKEDTGATVAIGAASETEDRLSGRRRRRAVAGRSTNPLGAGGLVI